MGGSRGWGEVIPEEEHLGFFLFLFLFARWIANSGRV